MSRRILLVGLAAVFFMPLLVRAQQVVIVPRDQTVSGNVVRTGERIDLDGTVDGDAILIGTSVTVAGKVTGDLIVASQQLTITGSVGGSVRAISQDLDLRGPVGRNITVVGQTVRLGDQATVAGSVAVASQELVSSATVSGSLDGIARTARIGGTVTQDVNLHTDFSLPRMSGGALAILSSAKIGGKVVHTGSSPTVVESGAAISAGVVEHPVEPSTRLPAILSVLSMLTWLFGLILVGIVLLLVVRGPVLAVVTTMERSPLRSLLIGFLVLVLFPPIAILLFFTLVAAPVALFATGLYLAALYLSRVFVALSVGQFLLRIIVRDGRPPHQSPLVAFTVGALALAVVVDVILGGSGNAAIHGLHQLANFGFLLWGFGGLLLTAWRLRRTRPA